MESVLVSACLLGEAVRYNSGDQRTPNPHESTYYHVSGSIDGMKCEVELIGADRL